MHSLDYQGTGVCSYALLCAVLCRTVALLRSAGCDVQLKTLPNKAHGMISSADEMQACMSFWAKRLKVRPADPGFVEVPAEAAAAVTQNLQ